MTITTTTTCTTQGTSYLRVGDRFKMKLDNWRDIQCPMIMNSPGVASRVKVEIEVLKVYAGSGRIAYLLKRCDCTERYAGSEFALTHDKVEALRIKT